MGFYLDGYILRPARVAPANAPTTSEASTGVVHDHVQPQDYGYSSNVDNPIDVCGLMYRSAVLDRTSQSTDEYCIWAASTGSLSTPPSSAGSFVVEGSADTMSLMSGPGNQEVVRDGVAYSDGSSIIFFQDPNGRNVSSIKSISFRRGDDPATEVQLAYPLHFTYDSSTRKITLTPAGNTATQGGFSKEAGDVLTRCFYSLSPPTFWWSRNDEHTLRFGWDGKNGRWAPYQGSAPTQLGILEPDASFTLSPKPTRFEADGNTYLPGDPAQADGYALLRVGLVADSSSVPIKTLVVQDSEAAEPYTFTGILPDAIVGETNGILQFNPNVGGILELKTGLPVWYNPETFVPTMDGDMGRLDDAANEVIVLSPIPGPTDRPFLRFGWRQHLSPIMYASDSLLPEGEDVNSGTFAWSMTTGKVVLSATDINKATPGTDEYELPYLGSRIYYDGVSMTQQPVPLREPATLLLEDGTPVDGDAETIPLVAALFVPRAKLLPFPGVSGIEYVPDSTGVVPNLSATPETRPNGSGLVRKVSGIGDTFAFAAALEDEPTYAFADLDIDEYEDDLSTFLFSIPNTEAEIARMEASSGPAGSSLIQFRRRGITDSGGFFAQSQMMPCTYAPIEEDSFGNTYSRIWSRVIEPFVFTGGETIVFYVGGTQISWSASMLGAGSHTAEEVADALRLTIQAAVPIAQVEAFRGRVCIYCALQSVEVGWNEDPNDVSGHAALGFLPGWRTEGDPTASPQFRWLPDNGMSFGLFRSPENVNAKGSTPDIAAVGVINSVITTSIPATPFLNLSVFPFEDVPGYDENVHFRMVQGLNIVDLKNYDGLFYDFAFDRVSWVGVAEVPSTQIQNPASRLQLGASLALPDTISSAAMAPLGTNFGLYLKEPTAAATTELAFEDDFLLPGDGSAGQALLTTPVGSLITQGAAARFSKGYTKFQDLNTSVFLLPNVEAGYLLRILNGDAEGVYTVTANYGDYLEVSPPFAGDAGNIHEPYGQWRIYEGFERDVYDPAVVADVQLDVFNQYLVEPFVINTVSLLGSVGDALSADAAMALERGRVMKVRFTPQTDVTYSEDQQASVSVLERGTLVGAFAQTGMFLPPDIVQNDSHFTASSTETTPYFAIRLGPNEYSAAQGNLSLVDAFSSPAGNVLEVGKKGSAIEGMIEAGAAVDADGETAYYDQVPLDPTLIPNNTCEMDPNTGDITLCQTDVTLHAGKRVYFVERMITENGLDVQTAPLTGSIMFQEPLRAGQLVEVDYYEADDNGDKKLDDDGNTIRVVEYLPLVVRLEECVRVDGFNYTFNPTTRTYAEDVEPFVWVGVNLQNYGGQVTCAVFGQGTADDPQSYIRFSEEVAETETVKINYGVFEAFGGEVSFSVSSPPVFRKPFFLEVGQDRFSLSGDRVSEFNVGALFLIGTAPFYVKNVEAGSDADGNPLTTVTVWPTPAFEVGSRAPGGDAAVSLSAVPVAIEVDPADPVPAGGAAGFLMSFSDAVFLPVDRGSTTINFYGDYREYTKSQHLIEIGGYPFVIAGATLSDDGRYTVVRLANATTQGFSWNSDPALSDTIRISVRPVILPGAKVFQGIAPFLNTEEYECFLLGSRDAEGNELPGTVLTADIHFTADPANGNITFTTPTQKPLVGGERLLFRYTQIDRVFPMIVDNAQYNPIYRAKHLSVLTPSMANGVLGSTLTARFTYPNADTFYCRVTPLVDYLPDVASAAIQKVSSSAPSGGPILAFPGAPINHKEGNLGLRGRVRDAKDLDRGGRTFAEFFNAVVVAWEQVLEAIDGRIIGDRDGKFRMFVGHGKQYAPPGYEDIYSGDLNKRNLWRLVVEEWADAASLADGYLREYDGIYGPTTYEEDTHGGTTPGDVDGETKTGAEIDAWIEFQRKRVKNDIDDRLLTGLRGGTFWATLFPWLEVKGRYEDMWQPHQLSRIYPERTMAFTRLFPGYDAVPGSSAGFYTAGKTIEVPGPEPGETTETTVSTRNTQIGLVNNPVFEDGIPNISDINVRNRFPRARIWAYYPDGNADLDAAMTALSPGFNPTVGKATFVVTPIPFSEFPIDQNTTFPDVSQLISNGGDLADAASGDFSLATPGFEPNTNRLFWGRPNEETGPLKGPDGGWGGGVRTSVYVDEVQLGCIITVNDGDGNVLAGSSVFEELVSPAVKEFAAERGDTLWAGTRSNPYAIPDPETTEPDIDDIAAAAAALEDYRVQYDIGVNRKKGLFIDKGFSRGWANDENFPFNLQALFGQNPPAPLSTIEADVSFTNTGQPIQIPALKGEAKNDSGDVSIPYMSSADTELSVLSAAASAMETIFSSDCVGGLIPAPTGVANLMDNEYQYFKAIYPTEIPDSGTLISSVVDAATDTNPNVLYTSQNMTPVLTAAEYTALSGIGSVRPYDFLFVEAAQPLVSAGTLEPAMTGILSVGDVSNTGPTPTGLVSSLETPRFVTGTAKQTHHYTARNVFGGNTSDGTLGPGVFVTEIAGATYQTFIDFSGVAGLTLDDGFGVNSGGLVNIMGAFTNAIVIDFYSPDPAYVGDPKLATIVISSPAIGSPVWAEDHVGGGGVGMFVVDGAGIDIDVGASGGPMGNRFVIESQNATGSILTWLGLDPLVPYDFTITVDTYIDQATSIASGAGLPPGSGGGSIRANIQRDRLTFAERYSFANALDREAYPQNGDTTHMMGMSLNVWQSPVFSDGVMYLSDVNACAYQSAAGVGINGGTWADPTYLTFKTRVGPSPDGTILAGQEYVGTFTNASGPGANDEEGLIRAMAFEFENEPTNYLNYATDTISGMRISVAPSSDAEELNDIFNSDTGVFPDATLINMQTGGNSAMPVVTSVWCPRTWVQSTPFPATSGALGNIEPGDIVVVGGDQSMPYGSVKTGTYLVRHAIEGTATAPTFSEGISGSTAITMAGTKGWLDLRFPIIESLQSSGEIKLSGVPSYLHQDNTQRRPVTGLSGYLFVIIKADYAVYDGGAAVGSRYTVINDSVYRIEFSGGVFDEETETLTATLTLGTACDAEGIAITDDEFFSRASTGMQVSWGSNRFPIVYDKFKSSYPSNNVVGYWEDNVGNPAVAGFSKVFAGNRTIMDSTTSAPIPVGEAYYMSEPVDPGPGPPWTPTAPPSYGVLRYRSPFNLTFSFTGIDYLAVVCNTPEDSSSFYEQKEVAVYSLDNGQRLTAYNSPEEYRTQGVAHFLKLQSGASGDAGDPANSNPGFWNRIHFTEAEVSAGLVSAPNILRCPLPGDAFVLGDDVDETVANPGHWALAGAFFEPSIPYSTITDVGEDPRVISESYPLTGISTAQMRLGARNFTDHYTGVHPEYVHVGLMARRIRRFHNINTNITDVLQPLRYVYETRRGNVDQALYPPATGDTQFTAQMDPANPWGAAPTTLGYFDDPGMNINAGDVLRLLDAGGNVIDTAEINRIDTTTSGRLILRQPGFTASLPELQTTTTFEIWLEQAPAPHQQSHDQLLDLLTDVEVRRVGVDYAGAETTGAYADEFNKLKDDTLTGTWADEGVQKGDYIVVDPAGTLYIDQERGARAIGDSSTIGRIGGNYAAGGTSELDDNRGFYLVEEVDGDTLTVQGASRFCGGADDGGDDVVFGSAGTSDYLLLPSVHASLLTGWTGPTGTDPARGAQEGQQCLRPTAPAVDNGSGELSYKSRDPSDFSLYKSIGPFPYRVIRPSPIFSKDAAELILFQRSRFLSWMEEVEYSYNKGGDYYVFQRDDHIKELPSATDPTAGLGVFTNTYLESLTGLTQGAPFESCSDCVSILDRRFFILDYRLDSETNPAGNPYTTFVTNSDAQRPVLIDYIGEALDTGDKFREQRFGWLMFRADRTDGSIVVARREARQLPSKLRKQRELAIQRKALEES